MDTNVYRQAALVLAKLDPEARDAVLDRMPTEQALRIRDALLTLDADDSSLQESAVQAFLATQSNAGSRIVAGHANLGSSSVAPSRDPSNDRPRLSSSMQDLLAHSGQSIANSLMHERPTTISALLSSMPGDRAASVLKLFHSHTRTRVLAILDAGINANAKVVDVVAEWICDCLAEASVEPTVHAGHRNALKAIMDEFDPVERKAMLTDLATQNPMLAKRLAEENAAEVEPNHECYC